jgi:hypothetical protein
VVPASSRGAFTVKFQVKIIARHIGHKSGWPLVFQKEHNYLWPIQRSELANAVRSMAQ